jgi:hypothetical protein
MFNGKPVRLEQALLGRAARSGVSIGVRCITQDISACGLPLRQPVIAQPS